MFYSFEFPNFQEAEKSIQFYQNLNAKDKDYELLQSEVNRLKGSLCGDKSGKSDESMKFSDLTVAPGRKAMLIGIVLALLNQFSGCFAMLNVSFF